MALSKVSFALRKSAVGLVSVEFMTLRDMLVKRGIQDIDAYIRDRCLDSTIVEFPESEIPEMLERLRGIKLSSGINPPEVP